MLAETETAKDLRFHIRKLILDTLTPEGVHQRLIRASILDASMKSPKLQHYMFLEQRRLTGEIAAMFSSATERGLVRKTFGPQNHRSFYSSIHLWKNC